MSQELKDKETTLIAELANRVMTATNKGRLDWAPAGVGTIPISVDEDILIVSLTGGWALLAPTLDEPENVIFAVFNQDNQEVGRVHTSHPALRFDLKSCHAKLLVRYSPAAAAHAANVSVISKMFGALDAIVGDDVVPETQTAAPEAAQEAALPTAHAEDEVEELDAEDESFVFQQDMAEQAAEFSAEAREQAGLPEEEPLAQLPGQARRPAPLPPPPAPAAPSPPRKKLVKKVVKRPVGPPQAPKSRVLD